MNMLTLFSLTRQTYENRVIHVISEEEKSKYHVVVFSLNAKLIAFHEKMFHTHSKLVSCVLNLLLWRNYHKHCLCFQKRHILCAGKRKTCLVYCVNFHEEPTIISTMSACCRNE